MQPSSVRGLRLAPMPIAAALVLAAALLAGCSSIGGGAGSESGATAATAASADGSALQPAQGGNNMLANALFGGPSAGKAGAVVLDPNDYQKTVALCPPVSIRPGTEQMTAYQAGGKPDPVTGAGPPISSMSSIVRTARECRATADGNVVVKVGVIGRTVAGPAGKAGTITVPLRIAVVQGNDKILKSELFKIPVTLTEPNLNSDFTKIYDSIELPIAAGNSDFRIYVGFDDAPPARGRSG